jgi:small-conductance mechanosensitive channel/CRP-like cAMP-binding protein
VPSLDQFLEAIRPLVPGLVTAAIFIVATVVLRLLAKSQAIREKLRLPWALLGGYLAVALVYVGVALYWRGGARVLEIVGLLILSLAAVLALSVGVFDLFLGRRRNVQAPTIVRDIAIIVVYTITIFLVLGHAGVDLTSVLTTSAVLTAIIGLALQDLLSNIIAGLALQIERPFRAGDWVAFEDQEGEVLEINWRSTRLFTVNHDIVVIPNSLVTKSAVVNFTAPTKVHRRKVEVGLEYDVAPNRAKAALLAAVRDVDGVLAEPKPTAALASFDESSVGYRLYFFVDDLPRSQSIEEAVRTRVWYQLRREGLAIPFPIRDVTVRTISDTEADEYKEREAAEVASMLGKVPLLQPLSAEELGALTKRTGRERFAAGESIIRAGDAGASFYVVAEGEVDVLVGDPPNVVATLGPGEFFGEMSLMTGEARSATVVARRDCELIIVDRDAFHGIIAANQGLVTAISEALETRRTSLHDARRAADDGGPREVIVDTESLASRIRKFFNL